MPSNKGIDLTHRELGFSASSPLKYFIYLTKQQTLLTISHISNMLENNMELLMTLRFTHVTAMFKSKREKTPQLCCKLPVLPLLNQELETDVGISNTGFPSFSLQACVNFSTTNKCRCLSQQLVVLSSCFPVMFFIEILTMELLVLLSKKLSLSDRSKLETKDIELFFRMQIR